MALGKSASNFSGSLRFSSFPSSAYVSVLRPSPSVRDIVTGRIHSDSIPTISSRNSAGGWRRWMRRQDLSLVFAHDVLMINLANIRFLRNCAGEFQVFRVRLQPSCPFQPSRLTRDYFPPPRLWRVGALNPPENELPPAAVARSNPSCSLHIQFPTPGPQKSGFKIPFLFAFSALSLRQKKSVPAPNLSRVRGISARQVPCPGPIPAPVPPAPTSIHISMILPRHDSVSPNLSPDQFAPHPTFRTKFDNKAHAERVFGLFHVFFVPFVCFC